MTEHEFKIAVLLTGILQGNLTVSHCAGALRTARRRSGDSDRVASARSSSTPSQSVKRRERGSSASA